MQNIFKSNFPALHNNVHKDDFIDYSSYLIKINVRDFIFSIIINILMVAIILVMSANAKTTFSGDRLKDACYEYVKKNTNKDADISISQSIKDKIFDEDGVQARCTGTKESFKGNCYVYIEFLHKDKVIHRTTVPARIRLYEILPIAIKQISKGNEIEYANLKYEKKEVTYIKSDDLILNNDFSGMKAKRNITEGSIIIKSNLEPENSVHRGDKVNMYIISGGVKITTSGEALEDCIPGENLKIKRDGTQDQFTGKLAKDGAVIINLK